VPCDLARQVSLRMRDEPGHFSGAEHEQISSWFVAMVRIYIPSLVSLLRTQRGEGVLLHFAYVLVVLRPLPRHPDHHVAMGPAVGSLPFIRPHQRAPNALRQSVVRRLHF
jgi:hypothetical protein